MRREVQLPCHPHHHHLECGSGSTRLQLLLESLSCVSALHLSSAALQWHLLGSSWMVVGGVECCSSTVVIEFDWESNRLVKSDKQFIICDTTFYSPSHSVGVQLTHGQRHFLNTEAVSHQTTSSWCRGAYSMVIGGTPQLLCQLNGCREGFSGILASGWSPLSVNRLIKIYQGNRTSSPECDS